MGAKHSTTGSARRASTPPGFLLWATHTPASKTEGSAATETEDEWLEWFGAIGKAPDPPPAHHRFRDRRSSLSAAEKGLGLGLGCTNLL